MRVVQPLANVLISLLARLRVNPLLVVLSHSFIGLLAAAFMAFGSQNFLAAALLLQLKTLLDNSDGGLARATGKVTLVGRYLDTVLDFFVNLTLFAALALYGPPLFALVALLLLTIILSLDYNMEHLYKALRYPEQKDDDHPIGAPLPLYRFFKRIYETLFKPQDMLIRRLDRAYFERSSSLPSTAAPLDLRLAWNDMFSTASLVNLGLSSQLFLLGLCLVLGHPFWYVWSIYLQALYILCVTLVRGPRFRSYLRSVHSDG